MAAPKPIVASIAGVPASNRKGTSTRDELARSLADDVLVHGDHPAAHLVEREALQPLALRVQDPDAAGTEGLVRARGEEIDVELLHVDGQVRDRLRRVEEHGHAAGVRGAHDLLDRGDAAGHVRHVAERDERVLAVKSDSSVSHRGTPSASIGHRDRACARKRHGSQLAWCSLAGKMTSSSGPSVEPVRDEVDRLGGPAEKDDLVRPGAEEPRRLDPRRVVELRRLVPERVHAAVHVRGAALVVVDDGVDDGARLRGRRRAVEEDERLAVERARQHRKLGPDAPREIVGASLTPRDSARGAEGPVRTRGRDRAGSVAC